MILANAVLQKNLVGSFNDGVAAELTRGPRPSRAGSLGGAKTPPESGEICVVESAVL